MLCYIYPMKIPYILLLSIFVQLSCQLFKVIYYSIKERKLSFSYFISAGGMLSAHTAFVSALTVSIALNTGVSSDLFAISLVFSTIVIYDAYRLRGTVEQISLKINSLIKKGIIEGPSVNERVGHSLSEILIGIFVGSTAAIGFFFII